MEHKLTDQEVINLREILVAHSIKVDALVQLMIEKGVFTKEEFSTKIRDLQVEYQK